jgi:dTDP-glucose pyrophosphorylase
MTIPNSVWNRAIISPDRTLHDAIQNLNEVALKLLLITDDEGCLIGTLTDGDIRRGLLRGLTMESPIAEIVHANPLVVPETMGRELVLSLMTANKIQQIPIVNKRGQLVGLHVWNDIVSPVQRPNLMVIMAGGKGTRLRPYTENCPKPMLTVSGKPILEHIIARAKQEGFSKFVLAVHYLAHQIEEYFGDGQAFGVQIDYLKEEVPLGTAGALSLLHPLPALPFIVTNGDVLSDIRYGELLDFHDRYHAAATMAVRIHEWQHPFGVVRIQGVEIVGFEEKPIFRSHINAGVYALSPHTLQLLSSDQPCDMPTLFEKVQGQDDLIIAYPMHEPWLDVGRPDDLLKANQR